MKKIKILLIALIMILGGVFFSNTYAEASGTRNLKAKLERPFKTESKYEYAVPPNNTKYTVVKIYEDGDTNYNKVFYCLRGGVGFGSEGEDVSKNEVTYNTIGEMHEKAKDIIAKLNEYITENEIKKKTIDRDVEFDISNKTTTNETASKKVTANLYNAILWILDEAYLPKDIKKDEATVYDASEYKQELLDKAGVPRSEQNAVTDNDIEVIQQLALWYFTNYDEQQASKNPTVSQATMTPANLLTITINGQSSNNIEDTRRNNLNRLYQYLVYGAINNASLYTKDTSTEEKRTRPVEENKFDKSTPLTKTSVEDSLLPNGKPSPTSYYKIGPVKFINDNVNSRESSVNATDIVLYDKDGNAIPKLYKINRTDNGNESYHTIYSFIKENGDVVSQLKKGETYYIKFYKAFEKGNNIIEYIEDSDKYDLSTITIKVSSSYKLSTAKFLSNGNTSQPVVELEKEKLYSSDELTTKEPKEFDLALRKFITAINNNTLIGENSRVPKINLTKLNTTDRTGKKITTATYEHPKNPLLVETNDRVVYTIRVYNEGATDGTATKIVDYLPDGLEFIDPKDSNINTTYKWTKSNDNEKIIISDYLTGKTIKAYNPDKKTADGNENWQKEENGTKGLSYEDVQVECRVVAQVGSSDKSLKNVAEIYEDNGDDRDSTPHNKHDPYDTWQEDDDDFEDLVLKAKEFDLALRKFISKVERPNKDSEGKTDLNITPRVPQIEIKGLKDGTSTTARYVHPKNQLSLKKGDIITYTIRVYNEGQIDGYAKKVTDYLPEGLELVKSEGGTNWTEGENNSITTTDLQDKMIKHYDKNITSAPQDGNWQQATDDTTGLYYYDLTVVCKIKDSVTEGTVLKNVAEITIDGSDPENFDDRDSNPDNVYDDQKHEPKPEDKGYTPGEEDDDDFESVVVEANEVFDLALRKYIVAVNGKNLEGDDFRAPEIDKTPLTSGETTAKYNHKKHPVEVEVGDIVTYRFTMYNEGEKDGYVYSVVDYLPAGLEFDKDSNDKFIEYKESYENDELNGKEYAYKIDGNKITITPLNNDKKIELKAINGDTMDSESIDVKFKITASESNEDQVLTNVATMTYGAKDSEQADRDSSGDEFTVPSDEELLADLPGYKGKDSNKDDLTDSNYYYENEEDDGDFEKVVIKGKPFDLSLRKYISSIKRNGKNVEISDRTPSINTDTLINGTFDRNGNKEYTATYEHSKEPIVVKKGDIITYTLRVYNEGARDGYAAEITDYIPEGLALILNYKTNYDNGWKLPKDVDDNKIMKLVGEDGLYKTAKDVKNLKLEDFSDTISLDDVQLVTGEVAITTTELNDQLLKAFDKNKTEAEEGWQKATTGDGGLYYKDVQVSCLVIAENTYKDTITNVAEISEDKDKDGNPVTDRDSTPNNKKDPYTTWQEDDDDYEQVVLRYFDLALRKFITGIETNGKSENITSRIPEPKIGEDGNIKYEHGKDPLSVANNDIITYTLRVYNEGTLAGYADEITDDIPEGLLYLPDNDTNKKYEWKMIDKDGKVTDKVEEAVKVTTDYLSEEKEKSEKRDNQIDPFDSSKGISTEKPLNPDYRDVKIAFRVIEPNTSDRTIVNSAQISKDSDDDEDSTPDEWIEPEDDQDREYVHVKYFDLSLLKWVTKTIVTVDGKTTTTETGFKPNTGKTETEGIRPNDKNEPVAKVEIDRKKIDRTTVKFVYKIRVTNEGEIAGYATEITDFIPSGLEFKAEDNKKYGWVKEGNDKVTTRALETVLLEPGKSAEVEIVFTWKKDKNNLGVKTNIAEITEDYNENNSKDIDSTPGNKKNPYEKEQEDDDDFALVILSLKTGKAVSYTVLITAVISMLAGGIYLIKRYIFRD